MKHILSRANVDLLAQLACSRVLLAFDYDGTLAPIVAARDHADMRTRTRKLLGDVCDLYPCAVISGRSREDVSARINSARVKYVVGNHGLEPGKNIASFERTIKAVAPQLEREIEGLQGVEIEDKRYSLSVHYRGARGKQRARAAIEAAVRRLDQPMRMIAGKLLVNVVPEGAPHKGDALDALRAREGADTALYVGDDSTDEDVFELDQPGQLLSIRVGQARDSAAAYYLRDQREIDVLLSKLRALRRKGRS